MNKEQIYDEQIDPLMVQIIEVCKTHGIAMLCTFHIPTPEEEDLQCTTLQPDQNGEHPVHHKRAMREIRGNPGFVALTITSPKGAP